MTWLIYIYILGWIGVSSLIVLALSDEHHPRPRVQALAIMGLGALWPLLVIAFVIMCFYD